MRHAKGMRRISEEAADLNLCDHCLGRLYGMLGHGLSNLDRGRAIRIVVAMERNEEYREHKECDICGGIFSRLEDYARYVVDLLREYEFSTFSVGSKFSDDVLEKEKEYVSRYSSEEYAEPIGREFNRELGKRISQLTGKEADLANPDVTVIVDTEYDDVRLEIKPLFLYGRYRKLVRGIPQTKWPSGKYAESVEELIAKPVMELTGGEGHALHGMGREDIDVRMLGTGRPFVLEIKRPKRRTLDLEEIMRRINEYASGKVEVTELRYATRADVRRVKEAKPRKRYRVAVQVNATRDEVEKALEGIVGKVRQRTPRRVAHRRADRVRIRHVYEARLVGEDNGAYVIEILAESGTYIKELMHGDDGRTRPSLAELLGKEVEVAYLDVLEILDGE